MDNARGVPAAAGPPVPPGQVIAAATAALAGAGVGTPRVDAELLAAHVLGVPRGALAGAAGFDPAARQRYERLVRARVDRVPLQHLTGATGFRYLELAVGPGVFIPRPETEVLLDWALARPAGPGELVLDLCAGSGAIALAYAQERPGARVIAVERSGAALDWLRRNAAARVAAGDPAVRVRAGDLTDPAVTADLRGQVDVLLCNPPYVPLGTPVPPEVSRYDPAEAVFAGPDGLAVIRPVLGLAADLLRPGGVLAIEHDDTHGATVPALLRAAGAFVAVCDHRDLNGRPRFATATRAART